MKRVDISAGAILLLSVIYFFGGITSLAALLLAVLIHELGHIAAIELCGGRVHGLKVTLSGLCISCSGVMGTEKSVICLCAGPASGFALAYAASYLGNLSQNLLLIKTAGFSLVLSVYNSCLWVRRCCFLARILYANPSVQLCLLPECGY